MLACAALIFLYYIFARRNISPAPIFFVPLYDATLAGYLVWAVSIAAGFMLTGLIVVEVSTGQGLAALFQEFLSQIVILVLGLTAGEVVRSRRALETETATRLWLAEEERAAEAGRVVAEERLRIARELHDAVAHSMATITVQASSALHLLDIDAPGNRLRAALTAIRETSKAALTDMRSVLGQLRRTEPGDHHAAGEAGHTGLARLEALRDAVTAAGAAVTVTVEGDQRPLSADADHSAYRILQESLTNVLRHAGPGTAAHVCLRYQPEALTITVTDDGPVNGNAVLGDGGVLPVGGHGIDGMRERAASVGDELTAGPLPGRRLPGQGHAARPDRGRSLVIRVLLAADQVLVRAGFRLLLESAGDIAVVAEAANGRVAVALTREHAPDVVLMDINMPEVDGVTATHLIAGDPRLGATKVVVLTTFDDEQTVFAALRAGASGFLVKDVGPEELLQAVRVVARGDALLSPSVTRAVIAAFAGNGGSASPRPGRPAVPGGHAGGSGDRPAPPGLASLTEREREVVALVASGLSNDEIARQLVVSPLTAKTHVSRAMTKLNARDRAQLVVLAYEHGLTSS